MYKLLWLIPKEKRPHFLLFVTFLLHPSTQVAVKGRERRESGSNKSRVVNKDFQQYAVVLLQLILESSIITMKGGEGKGTEHVRLVLSVQIATKTVLKGSSVIFLIQMT